MPYTPYVIAALYKFVRLDHYQNLREPLLAIMRDHHIFGTLLLAREGINGTVASTRTGIDALLKCLENDPALDPLEVKESYHAAIPFKRQKVKLKKEIVTMGVPDIDPNQSAGTYVEPGDWNELISDPQTVLIDTRNDYEVQIGSFQNAIDPDIRTFRDFPQYVDDHIGEWDGKKVAMFCTGGIRCEKSTAYLREKGFDQVFHLKGGILKYLEQVPQDESMWEGECFVFDERVAVNHELERGQYDLCYGCRRPISEADKQSKFYIPGVACHRCYHETDERQRARFLERQKQVDLALARGETHIGEKPATSQT